MEKGLIIHTLIFNRKKEILILKRSASTDVLPNYWDLPGGTLMDSEDPIKGALREIKEETGIKVGGLNLFNFRNDIDKRKNKQFITLVFISKYKSGKIRINPREHEDYRWTSLMNIGKYRLVDYLENCVFLLKNKKHQLLKFY